MDFYKEKIKYDGSLDKLISRIVVRGYMQNNDLIRDTCSLTASMRNLIYLLVDSVKYKARVHQLDFIGAFLQSKVNNRIF